MYLWRVYEHTYEYTNDANMQTNPDRDRERHKNSRALACVLGRPEPTEISRSPSVGPRSWSAGSPTRDKIARNILRSLQESLRHIADYESFQL